MPTSCQTYRHRIWGDIEKLAQLKCDIAIARDVGFPVDHLKRSIQELSASIEVRLAVMGAMKEEEGKE